MSDIVDRPSQEPEDMAQASSDQYDVAILGGGMAGLTLALQIKKTRPATRIVVLEKQKHPVPEAAHKVGESTAEVAAHYLRDVLGLEEHLQTQHVRKLGLRMFFSTDSNQDITERVEYGQTINAPLAVYQIDRGRLENALGREVQQHGVVFLDGCKVQQVSLQPQGHSHRLHVLHAASEREIQARWVVDASGRSALLKRQLGLAKKASHHANAVWFRIGHPINVDDWSDDPDWQARINGLERWRSTNHLMGPGYWVWLIPLASGSTSIGIVTDASMHAFEEMNLFERAMNWLHVHEPQCAAMIEPHLAKVQDFRVMKNYAYGCQQAFSSDRWCLTGEAAIAIDPLYSPGSDQIAIGNGLICDLITRDLNGEDIEQRAANHNLLFLIFAESSFSVYEQQYPLMGNAQVMVAKIIWDIAFYWGFIGLLYFHDAFPNLVSNPSAIANVYQCWSVFSRVQAFFREWHAIDQSPSSNTFADPYLRFDFLLKFHIGMAAGLADAELEAQLTANVRLLGQLAGQLVSIVIEMYADDFQDEAIQSQIQRWQTEPFLIDLMALYRQEDAVNPIDSGWITLGKGRALHLSEVRQEVSR